MTVDSGRENKQLLVFGRSGCYKKMSPESAVAATVNGTQVNA
jgi:hypothetical protein